MIRMGFAHGWNRNMASLGYLSMGEKCRNPEDTCTICLTSVFYERGSRDSLPILLESSTSRRTASVIVRR